MRSTIGPLLISLSLIGCIRAQGGKTMPLENPAPEFSLAGSDGKTYNLADFRGKQAVVIAWFPKAFTGG